MMGEQGETITIEDGKITKLREKLRQAIQFNKSSLFRQTIDYTGVASCCSALESYDPDCHMSPFEIACNEAHRDYYIRECIAIGCDANRKNPKCGRRPISFAIEQLRYYNLEVLLCDTSVCVDVEHSSEYRFTPINYLLKRISDQFDEFNGNSRCIELLVKHGADVNIAGKDGKTPIRTILEKKNLNDTRKRILLQCIFDHSKYIDIDDENDAIRTQISKLFPDLKLPTATAEINQDQKLKVAYANKSAKEFDSDETAFWQYYRLNKDHSQEAYWHSALHNAVRCGLTYSVERILRSGFITTMHSLDECKEPLLKSAVRAMGRNDDANIEKCMDLFLNHGKLKVNAQDKFGFSPLFVFSAVKSVETIVTTKLLECGAYIGVESKWGDVAIANIKPHLLEQHFDRCITTITTDGDNTDDNNESLQLTFDYKNLIQLYSGIPCPDRLSRYREMKAIECIMETYNLRHLIKHPLIQSFLELKWNQLAFIFFTNFFFYAIFAVLNIVYILVFFLDDIDPIIWITLGQIILLCAMIGRETIQMLSSPHTYFKRYQNCLECALIGLITYILFGNCPIVWRGTVSAATILLIAYELSLLIGSLPIKSVAMHYVMLETVATNFFKSLLFYSTIIAAFAFAFCCLFHTSSITKNDQNNIANRTDDEYNNFQSVGLSIIKSIVMANGELDTSSIQFNGNVFSYIVFVAFILLVTTVLGNLLSGLAVSDINEIRSQAQWTHLIRRCELLTRYEKSFRKENCLMIWFQCLRYIIRSKICLYPESRLKYQKTFFVNKRREKGIRKAVGSWFLYLKGVICLDSPPQVDKDILKEALKRVKQINVEDGIDVEVLRNEISKIADSNVSMQQQIDFIVETMKSIEAMLKFQNKDRLR